MHAPYVLPLVTGVAISIIAAIFAWRRRPIVGAATFSFFMLTITGWGITCLFTLLNPNLEAKMLYIRMGYLFSPAAVALWLVLAFQYLGLSHYLHRRTFILLSVEPILTLLAVWTNPLHELFFRQVDLQMIGPWDTLTFNYGPLFYAHMLYTYLLLMWGSILLVQIILHSSTLFINQTTFILLGSLLPWLGNIIHFSTISPLSGIELTPFIFGYTSPALAWGFFKLHLLDIIPIAYGLVIENMSHGVIVVDANDRVANINPSAELILGRRRDQTVGRPSSEIFKDWPLMQKLLSGATETNQETILETRRGRSHYELRLTLLKDPQSHRYGRLIVLRDINTYKQAEDDLRQRADELEALNETMLDVVMIHNLPTLLHSLVMRAASLLNAQGGLLFLADPEERLVRCVVCYNSPTDITGEIVPYGEGLSGQVAETGMPLIISDYRAWPGRRIVSENEEEVVGMIGVPLLWQGEATGVLCVLDTRQSRKFNLQDMELLAMFANQAAIAVENARLMQAEHEQREQADTLREVASTINISLDRKQVLELILEQLARVVSYDSASLMLESGGLLQIVAEKGFRAKSQYMPNLEITPLGHLQQVLTEGAPVIIPDTYDNASWVPVPGSEYIRSWLGVPLIFKGRAIGILNLDKETPGFYTEQDTSLALTFANQAATAIENARLFHTERHRAEAIKALLDISEGIASSIDLAHILRKAALAALRLLPVDRVMIFLYDEKRDEIYPTLPMKDDQFELRLSAEQRESFTSLRIPVSGTPLLQQMKCNGQPIAMRSWEENDQIPAEALKSFGASSFLAVPFITLDQFLGMLYVDCVDRLHTFTEEEIEIAAGLARQTTLAIERSRLFEAVQRRADEAETLRQATAALTGTLQRDEAITLILEQLARVVEYDSASVQILYDGYLEIVGGRGWPKIVDIVGMRFPIPGDNPNTTVIQSRQPLIVKNTDEFATFRKIEHLHIRSWLGLPLIFHDHVVGMLAVDSKRENAFTEDHLYLACSFANQVAVAIENVRLYTEVEQRAEELSRLYAAAQDLAANLDPNIVLDKLARHLTIALDCTSSYILEVDEEHNTMKVVSEFWSPEANEAERIPALGKIFDLQDYPAAILAFRSGEAVHHNIDSLDISDHERQELLDHDVQSALIVPIAAYGRILGEVEIWDSRRKHTFTPTEKRFAMAMAQHAAAAFENAYLYASERRRVNELDALRATLADISSELELSRLLQAILERAVLLLDATGGDLGIYDPRIQTLEVVSSFNMGRDYTGVRMAVGEGAMGYVIKTKQPLIIPHYQSWEGRSPQYIEGPWHGLVAVPLQMAGSLLGALGVVDSNPARRFSESDQHLLTLFAQQAAIAIENARLYQEAREAAERRAVLHHVSQEIIAANLDPEGIYQAIHQAAAMLMSSEAFVIALKDEARQAIDAVYLVDKSGRTPSITIPVDAGLSGYVINTGKSVIIDDVQTFDDVSSIQFGDEEDVRSLVAAPMRLGSTVLGMISTQTYQVGAYTSEDVHLLEMLAAYAAIALDNARLFQEVEHLAITDPLTGIYNRRQLFVLGQREFGRTNRFERPMTVMMIDIDHFKRINDTYGHTVGDTILVMLTYAIQNNIREIDILGRYGGDEFALILPETDLSGGLLVAERLRSLVDEMKFKTEAGDLSVTISVGVSSARPEVQNLEALLGLADAAMYAAKQSGRNQVRVEGSQVKTAKLILNEEKFDYL